MIVRQDNVTNERTLEELLADKEYYSIDCSSYLLFIKGHHPRSVIYSDSQVKATLTAQELGTIAYRLLANERKPEKEQDEELQRFFWHFKSDLNMAPVWLSTVCAYGKTEVSIAESLVGLPGSSRILPGRSINYKQLEKVRSDCGMQLRLLNAVFSESGAKALIELAGQYTRKWPAIHLDPKPPRECEVLTLPMVVFGARGSQLHIDFEYTSSHGQAYEVLRRSLHP